MPNSTDTPHPYQPLRQRLAIAAAMGLLAAVSTAPAADTAGTGSIVTIEPTSDGGWRMSRNGRPFVAHGVGGTEAIDVLAACGGNALRTWDAASALAGTAGRPLLDRAHESGIAVTVGLWLGHERHGFRYDDPTMVEKQRAAVNADVQRLKAHPALLCWGLGNEMEGPTGRGDSAAVWREVGHLARAIKAIDPAHPVMTVVANVNPDKIRAIREHAADIDILGVNAYAGAAGIGDSLRQMGWKRPYCITEYGLPGPWEVEHTPWKAPLEPSSRRKAALYNVTTRDILSDRRQCLGAYAFLWGSKQEATATWFGMLLPTGEKTITADAVAEAWTGRWPANRAPVLGAIDVPLAGKRIGAATVTKVRVAYRDPEGDPLDYSWEVRAESVDRREGGDAEQTPRLVEGCVSGDTPDGAATITAPRDPGPYRLFVTVRDGKGSGCSDNWPFFVEP